MSTETNKAVLLAHVQAMNEQRLETLDEHPGIAHTRPFFQMKIVDGKIVEDHGQADNITLMQQLGGLPAPVGA
jgi:hypothetical protein